MSEVQLQEKPQVYIQLFGAVEVNVTGSDGVKEVRPLPSKQVLTALVLLACRRKVMRKQMMLALWPTDPAYADQRNNFNTAMSRVREYSEDVLHADLLEPQSKSSMHIELEDSVSSDVLEFVSLASEGLETGSLQKIDEAIDLYEKGSGWDVLSGYEDICRWAKDDLKSSDRARTSSFIESERSRLDKKYQALLAFKNQCVDSVGESYEIGEPSESTQSIPESHTAAAVVNVAPTITPTQVPAPVVGQTGADLPLEIPPAAPKILLSENQTKNREIPIRYFAIMIGLFILGSYFAVSSISKLQKRAEIAEASNAEVMKEKEKWVNDQAELQNRLSVAESNNDNLTTERDTLKEQLGDGKMLAKVLAQRDQIAADRNTINSLRKTLDEKVIRIWQTSVDNLSLKRQLRASPELRSLPNIGRHDGFTWEDEYMLEHEIPLEVIRRMSFNEIHRKRCYVQALHGLNFKGNVMEKQLRKFPWYRPNPKANTHNTDLTRVRAKNDKNLYDEEVKRPEYR